MSPITHALTGWVLAQPLEDRKQRLAATAAAVVSDLDGLSLLFGVDAYQKWHHTFGHNLIFGLVLATLTWLLFRSRKAATLTVLAYHSHLVCDLLGSGADWGIPYFWPFSSRATMFAPPFQWELNSWQNLVWTLGCIGLTVLFALKKKRTFIEFVSKNADAKVVKAIEARFSKAA